MTSPADRLTMQWEEAGARVAPSVAGACAVLVTGRDPVAAAHAALGLARAEAPRRRVALGDLVGDVPPIIALVADDDPHGLVDSFLYGVSLNKVAHPARDVDNLFVLPSGTEPVLTEEIFRSDRWRRLASGFREVGALLILVAPADAPGLDDLVGMLDGVVAVGDETGTLGERFPLLASVDGWRASRPTPDRGGDAPLDEPPSAQPWASPRARRSSTAGAAQTAAPRRSLVLPLLLLAALVAGGGAALWWRERQAEAPAPRPAAPDSAARDSARAAAAPRDSVDFVLTPMNPGDSAAASMWTIEVGKFNTESGAQQTVQQAAKLPGTTWFALRLANDPGLWYRVVGGAWRTREGADSALAALKQAKAVLPTASVLRAPFALQLRFALPADSLRAEQLRFERAGLPTYALRQDDGTYALYTGAFETPDQSIFLALAVQQAGTVPTLYYRTGRAP